MMNMMNNNKNKDNGNKSNKKSSAAMSRFIIDEAREDMEYVLSAWNRSKELNIDPIAKIEVQNRRKIQRMKRTAESLGLAYWPALYHGGCDPRAYVYAERVLYKIHGTTYGERDEYGDFLRGGWDSAGYYGISPWTVRKMWFASGCKLTRKFWHQVETGTLAKKGDSFPWFVHYARGVRWLTEHRISSDLYGLVISRKAIAALGKLSPELRRVALGDRLNPEVRDQLPREEAWKPIRIRDLDWEGVRRVRDMLLKAKDPSRLRAALSGERRACNILGTDLDHLVEALTPNYSRITIGVARRITLGESPVQISGGILTKAEAHLWMSHGAPQDINEWLADQYGLPNHRSVKVLRWLQHCKTTGRWSAVEREREAHVPGEVRPRRYSLLSVVDEVHDVDIVTGKDSVDAVLQRTAERLGDMWLNKQMGDHRLLVKSPAWVKTLPKGVRFLNTPAQLAQEGKEMGHCVGGYRDAVETGQCYILSIRTNCDRSTAEINTRTLGINQHRSYSNRTVHKRQDQYLKALLNRIIRQGGE